MTAPESKVRVEVRDAVAYLTLEAPPHNILTCAVMDEMDRHLERIHENRELKAVALAARGRAFSAGADVGEHTPEQAPHLIRSFGRLFRRLHDLPVPLVIGVQGAALGAGFELAMMADVLLAGEGATFGQPEIRLGFFAPVGVVHLPSLVGRARAAEIVCSGRTYSAAEMKEMGLVRRVVPDAELPAAMEAVLGDLRKASPAILRLNVRMVKEVAGRDFTRALERAETVFLEELMAMEEVGEGIAAFFEKRRPVWKNR